MTKAKPRSLFAGAAELWLPIPGLEHYEVSDAGRVRSLDRVLELVGRWGPMTRFHKGKILRLKAKYNGSSGIYWSFYAGAEGGYWQVNRAVCMAFNGPPPSGQHEAAHVDGNPDNNRPPNLIWATPIENASHKIRHGTASVGSKNGASRLDESDIQPIFEAYCSGIDLGEIALQRGVTRGCIIQIVGSRVWKHVDVGDLRAAAKLRARSNLERTWHEAKLRRARLGPSLRAAP